MKKGHVENANDIEAANMVNVDDEEVYVKEVQEKVKEVKKFYEDNSRQLERCGECIEKTLNELDLAYREFNPDLFFILMFGPLKAGKSTLTNLLANRYVSPTSYGYEKTLRTSLIMKAKDGEKPGIYVYKAQKSSLDHKKLFDDVISVLRGTKEEESIRSGVQIDYKEWDDKTVDEQLTGQLEDNPLITVLKVEGGGILTEKIALIDMPGLDGVKSNCENSFIHEWILKRADFLIFIQSSMAALNKTTFEFLNDAYNLGSRKPELWLVQNEIEAKHWRDEDELNKENEKQRDRAKAQIVEVLNNPNLTCMPVNLGKAWDGRKKPNDEWLKKSKYLEFEEKLKKVIDEQRVYIQRKNSVKGVLKAVEFCTNEFAKGKQELQSDIDEFIAQEERLPELNAKCDDLCKKIKKVRIEDSLKKNLKDYIDEWKKICEGELSVARLFNDMTSTASASDLGDAIRKGIDKINSQRDKWMNLKKSEDFKGIINEVKEKIVDKDLGKEFGSLNECLKNLKLKPYEEKSQFEPKEDKAGEFKLEKRDISKMITDAKGDFELLKLGRRRPDMAVLCKSLQKKYDEYADQLNDTILKHISAEFDSWKESYSKKIQNHTNKQVKEKEADIRLNKTNIVNAQGWIKELEKKYGELDVSCNKAMKELEKYEKQTN